MAQRDAFACPFASSPLPDSNRRPRPNHRRDGRASAGTKRRRVREGLDRLTPMTVMKLPPVTNGERLSAVCSPHRFYFAE